MKHLIKTIALVAILSIVLSSLCAVTTSAEQSVTGIDFMFGNYYQSSPKSLMLPCTYEATVCFPADQDGRGGVIIGTYIEQDIPLFNFEIYENGAPRIYIKADDANVTPYNVVFTDVNVFNGKPTHVAITMDHTEGLWSCYVDGVLQQIIAQPAPTPFLLTANVRFGGDLRTGNPEYFKGIIRKVALYRDVRSYDEIKTDATANTFAPDEIICAYDLSDNTPGNIPENIHCVADSGISFKYYKTWIKDLPEPENYDYSFALIGDIQSLNYYYPDQLPVLFDWIRDNAESKKIKFAVGLGDITERNTAAEYARVNQVYSKLRGVVPFSIVRGNHDRSGQSSALFEEYIDLVSYAEVTTNSFDSTMLNTYKIIEVGETKYLFLNLDFLLRHDVLRWANDVISQNKDCQVIVSTHIYMKSSGDYYNLDGDSGLTAKYGCENNGESLWNKVLSRHENVIMMICGHNPTDNITYRTKKGVNGNKVVELLVDPQDTDRTYGGTGLVAMLYFSNGGKDVEVQYYSTTKNAYFKSNNQFKFTIDVPGDEEPETTVTDTTPVQTAPAQTTPVTTPVTTPTTTPAATAPVDNGGCGAAVMPTALFCTLSITGAALIKKKRK